MVETRPCGSGPSGNTCKLHDRVKREDMKESIGRTLVLVGHEENVIGMQWFQGKFKLGLTDFIEIVTDTMG